MACLFRSNWTGSLALLLSMMSVPSLGIAQTTPSREDLREPVYRVGSAKKVGDQPITEPLVGTAQPSTTVSPPSATAAPVPSLKDAPGEKPIVAAGPSAGPNVPVPPAELPETKVASLAPAVCRNEPALAVCESQRILNEAVADAENSLAHIRENIHDYTCLLVKREKVHGEVLPTEIMKTKVRNRKIVDGKVVVPFAVHMRFLKPAHMQGREAIYIEGQFNDQVRVKEGGTRGRFLPSVLLNPSGRFALQDQRYPITEIGIENLVQRLIERSQADTAIDVCEVTYRNGAKIDGRPCKFLQVKRPTPKTGDALKFGMNVFLAQVFIDEDLNIPIRYAAYDWPVTPGGPPEVVEEYTYQKLQINVGLTDKDFDYQNPEYNF